MEAVAKTVILSTAFSNSRPMLTDTAHTPSTCALGNRSRFLLLAVSFAAVMARPTPAFAVDVDLSAFVTNRINLRANYRDTTLLFDNSTLTFDTSNYLAPRPLDTFYSGFIELGANATFTRWLSTRLWLNSGEVREQSLSLDGTTTLQNEWTANGRLLGDEATATLFIREALLDFHDPDTNWWSVRLGRKQWRIADSLIYDDFGLGASIDFDFDLKSGSPWRLSAMYIIPSRDWVDLPVQSPLVSLRADYVLSLFDSISLSLTYFHDGNGELTQVIRDGDVEAALAAQPAPNQTAAAFADAQQETLFCYLTADFNSSADLFYGALSINKTLGPGVLSGSAVLSGGEVTVYGSPVVSNGCKPTQDTLLQKFPTLSGAMNFAYRWRLTPHLQLTPFFVAESGSNAPGNGQLYSSYLGVVPFVTRTFLFFAGGLNETFGARRVIPSGVNGRGVIAPGLDATYDPWSVLRLRAIASPLFSWAGGVPAPEGGSGSFYGMELDSLIDYRPWRYVGLEAEADIIFGGDFYRGGQPIWKIIAGIDLMGTWHH